MTDDVGGGRSSADGAEIARLTDLLGQMAAKVRMLEDAAETFRAGYALMAELLAKSLLSTGARSVKVTGPHKLPDFHLGLGHTCSDDRESCVEDVAYHEGALMDCQPCLQQAAALVERSTADPARRTLPGRPWGLQHEERN